MTSARTSIMAPSPSPHSALRTFLVVINGTTSGGLIWGSELEQAMSNIGAVAEGYSLSW
jgi:hypothetical protein